MKRGDKVRCVHAPESGIPVTEGETYTVRDVGDPRRLAPEGAYPAGDLGRGVVLREVAGVFRLDRFEVIA